ncbi:MAG: hypothetical protein KDA91_19670 [Planctomycetaceae bacterium]|nr:hypothetical protein [Planctomycetaceae bacterium]
MRNGSFCLLISLLLTGPVRGESSGIPAFLQPGQDYVMKFAGPSPFEKSVRISVGTDQAERNGGRRTKQLAIEVFTIVSRAGGSWVLVEHPKEIDDATKWNAKRVAMASLTPQSIAALQSTEDGRARLEQLRARASVEIETSRTWVNVDHVVTIRKVPIEPSQSDSPGLKDGSQ